MKAKIFERVEDLDTYLLNKKAKDVEVVWKSWIAGEHKEGKATLYDMVDRFFVLER